MGHSLCSRSCSRSSRSELFEILSVFVGPQGMLGTGVFLTLRGSWNGVH
uniref:Uncharacterized protein n=1 Tax=Anguilla anguilla TaxID=7936 RepID=A0A0E9XLR4_ANGAN